MAHEVDDGLALQVEQGHLVVRAPGQHPVPVAAETHVHVELVHRAGGRAAHQFSLQHMVDPQGLVPARRGHERAVAAQGQAVNLRGVVLDQPAHWRLRDLVAHEP